MNTSGKTNRSRPRLLGNVMLSIFAATMLVAGILKIVNLSAFAEALNSWTLIPTRIRLASAVLVPAAEISLALCWLLRVAPIRGIVGLGGMVILFAVVYAAQSLFAEPPQCNCFGVWLEFHRAQDSWKTTLVRNGVLIAIWSIGLVLWRAKAPTAAASHAPA